MKKRENTKSCLCFLLKERDVLFLLHIERSCRQCVVDFEEEVSVRVSEGQCDPPVPVGHEGPFEGHRLDDTTF